MQCCFKTKVFFLLTCVLMNCPVWAGSCVDVEGAASTMVSLEDFAGTANLTINGRNHFVQVRGVNFGFTETEDDGTQHAVTGTDWIIQGNGLKFTTIEDARLEPTDVSNVFRYVGRSRGETGNRRYNCGEMLVTGEVDFNSGVGDLSTIRGKLCRCD